MRRASAVSGENDEDEVFAIIHRHFFGICGLHLTLDTAPAYRAEHQVGKDGGQDYEPSGSPRDERVQCRKLVNRLWFPSLSVRDEKGRVRDHIEDALPDMSELNVDLVQVHLNR